MHIIIFGASGKVGRLVTQGLLEAGHEVTAFVHRSPASAAHPRLRVIQGDVHDADTIAQAVTGHDAVISTLGSWGTPTKDILTAAMANIIPAMQSAHIRRIFTLTGVDSRWSKDTLGPVHRVSHKMLHVLAPQVLRDGEAHIELLESSSLDWTVLRSPAMITIGRADYKLTSTRPMPWLTIHRQAVAQAIIDQATATDYFGNAPYLTRG